MPWFPLAFCMIVLDTQQDSPGRVISPPQRPLHTQDNTTQKHKDKHPFLKGIRTHDPSNQAAKTYAMHHAATGTGAYLYICRLFNDAVSSLFYNYGV
jgi:hypothetical protein